MPQLPPGAAEDPEAMKKLMDQAGGASGGGMPGLPGGMPGGMGSGGLPGLPGGGFGAPGGGRKATKSPKKKRRK